VSEAATNLESAVPQELEPARPTSPAERLGAIAEVVLCSGFPTQLFLATLMSAFGMRLQTADGQWSPLFVSVLSLLDTVLVVGLVALFLRTHGQHARDVLIGWRSPLREAVWGLALLVPMLVVAALILRALLTVAPQLHNVTRNPFQAMLTDPIQAAIFGLVVVVAGGVREEIQRGFILHRFEQYLGGGVVGVIVYSAAFGLGHVEQGWDAAIAVSALGAIWGTIYLIRRSVIAPMVSHAGFNLAQVLSFLALR